MSYRETEAGQGFVERGVMLRTLRSMLALLTVLALGAAPVLAQADPGAPVDLGSPLYLIVPFGEPGDTDPQMNLGTQNLAQDLSDRRVRSAIAEPIDSIDAVSQAPALCTQYGAAGLLVSALKFEQSKERNLTGFIPMVGGVISSSGAFDASPIRARYKMYLVDCRGKVAWKTITTANKVHHGTNVNAGLTEIALQAIAAAVDQFVARRPQTRAN
jgi:hypothetical protein